MEDQDQILNRVAASSLITFDLEEYYQPGERVLIDIKDQLFQGLILKEKDFRNFVKLNDWTVYKNKFVAITCSTDAVVPVWAYMLLTIALEAHASYIVFGTLEDLEVVLFRKSLANIEWSKFSDAKVVVKGCSKISVPSALYVEVARSLKPYVSSLMFGEACSSVPLFKKPKKDFFGERT
jgi:hypothetical protein